MEYNSSGYNSGMDISSSSNNQLAFPQLHVPPVPNMVAVPAPEPVKRLPPVGYDMRTLRRQMDMLYAVRLVENHLPSFCVPGV